MRYYPRYLKKFPSLKSLMEAFPATSKKELAEWRRAFRGARSYAETREVFKKFSADIGYGDEAIWGRSPCDPILLYCNMGDTYTPTLLWTQNWSDRSMRIGCWGDFVEAFEKRHYRLP